MTGIKSATFTFILSICIVCVGCGAKETPVNVDRMQEGVQHVQKELTIAEREALYEAKKKAERFYDWFDTARGIRQVHQSEYMCRLNALTADIQKNPDFSTWRKNDITTAMSVFSISSADIERHVKGWVEDYDYLMDVHLEVLREKTATERAQVKADIENIKIQYLTEFEKYRRLYQEDILKEYHRR